MLRCSVVLGFLACLALGRRMQPPHEQFDASKVPSRSRSLASILLAAACASGRSRNLSKHGILSEPSPRRRAKAYMEVKSEVPKTGGETQYCGEDVMSQKGHGTSTQPVQSNLKWNVDLKNADRICNFNRHYAEYSGYFKNTQWAREVDADKPTVYYDSVSGLPLYVAPIGRTMDEFVTESNRHGWPSFRQQEVVWENVRVLKGSGEVVSKSGTHLGHNLPDRNGARHCINLVSIAGRPLDSAEVDISPAPLEPPPENPIIANLKKLFR